MTQRDVVHEANDLCELARWREDKRWIGIQWYPTRLGHSAMELRNEPRADGLEDTRARSIGELRRYLDCWEGKCFQCGGRFELTVDEQLDAFDGNYPTPNYILCCSDECLERYHEDAGVGEDRVAT